MRAASDICQPHAGLPPRQSHQTRTARPRRPPCAPERPAPRSSESTSRPRMARSCARCAPCTARTSPQSSESSLRRPSWRTPTVRRRARAGTPSAGCAPPRDASTTATRSLRTSRRSPPPSRTKWTRLVQPSVLVGHVSSIAPSAAPAEEPSAGAGGRGGGARGGVALTECAQEHFACHVCAAAVGENPCEVARPRDASPAPLHVPSPPQRPDPVPAGQAGQAGGGRQLFYADYPQLQAHFRAAHFPCADPSCEARRPPPGRPRRCSASASLSPTALPCSAGPLRVRGARGAAGCGAVPRRAGGGRRHDAARLGVKSRLGVKRAPPREQELRFVAFASLVQVAGPAPPRVPRRVRLVRGEARGVSD